MLRFAPMACKALPPLSPMMNSQLTRESLGANRVFAVRSERRGVRLYRLVPSDEAIASRRNPELHAVADTRSAIHESAHVRPVCTRVETLRWARRCVRGVALFRPELNAGLSRHSWHGSQLQRTRHDDRLRLSAARNDVQNVGHRSPTARSAVCAS